MNDKVVLDDRSFKALSADSRVSILKSLGERRRTLSELSTKLSLGNSTIKEHCDILIDAELIRLVDEGRKWKYYELTPKGKQIVSPNLFDEVKVLIVLGLGAVIFGGFIMMILSATMLGATSQATNAIDNYAQKDAYNAQIEYTDAVNEQASTKMLATGTAGAAMPALNRDLNDQNDYESGDLKTYANQAPPSDVYAQCTIQQTPQPGVEFYISSTILALIFGMLLGWVFTRRA